MKKEHKTILVPVDFKPASLEAIAYGVDLAKKHEGDLILLHVLETPGLLAEFFSKGDHLVKLTDHSKEELIQLADPIRARHPEIAVKTKVERGKLPDTILHVAKETHARMIILGENHQTMEAGQQLGSTVYHVTMKSPVPVLTIKGLPKHEIKDILVPLDLTRETHRQLTSALLYGKHYAASVHLVSAVIGGIRIRDSRIYRKLKKAKKTLEENGVNAHIKLFERSDLPPYARVLQYADELPASLILLMTHQEGYTFDNYIGAFAHHIINESRIPVLSLTSSASQYEIRQVFGTFVDPLGMLMNK